MKPWYSSERASVSHHSPVLRVLKKKKASPAFPTVHPLNVDIVGTRGFPGQCLSGSGQCHHSETDMTNLQTAVLGHLPLKEFSPQTLAIPLCLRQYMSYFVIVVGTDGLCFALILFFF